VRLQERHPRRGLVERQAPAAQVVAATQQRVVPRAARGVDRPQPATGAPLAVTSRRVWGRRRPTTNRCNGTPASVASSACTSLAP